MERSQLKGDKEEQQKLKEVPSYPEPPPLSRQKSVPLVHAPIHENKACQGIQNISKALDNMSMLDRGHPAHHSITSQQQYKPSIARHGAMQQPPDLHHAPHPQNPHLPPYHVTPGAEYQERIYRGPKPTIPQFVYDDPREFSRLKMALDNLLPSDATEHFKYQILVDHLKLEDALLIADSYSNSLYPYSDTMAALTAQYGQPHQLALKRIAELMDGANIRDGDSGSFHRFALKVRAPVGMLDQLGENGKIELHCGSHVTRLTSKLPHALRTDFCRYALSQHIRVPTLYDF